MKILMMIAVGVWMLAVGAVEVKVDFDREVGRIKPLHGIGQGPLRGFDNFTMFKYLKEAGIPYSRLHDVGGAFGMNLFVDIPNLFRDFDADETDPKNYDFTFTDLYLKNLIENGVEPYFRLGVTIENAAPRVKKAYRILPPKDPAKWARICEHVIRHYTEGWADGYRWKIEHWEIWNEPDDYDGMRNHMWWGTWKEFIELYVTTAKHLKKHFPHLKIGGYGSCLGNCEDPETLLDPEASIADKKRRIGLFREFLKACREHGAPMDFHSFHAYRPASILTNSLRQISVCMREAGFERSEIHLTEWNVGTTDGVAGTPSQAAEIAGLLLVMQHLPIQVAHLYDGRCALGNYAPLFDPLTRRPRQAYYALKDFNVLYRLGTEVACSSDGVKALAAKGTKGAAVMVVNDSAASVPVVFDFGGREIGYCLMTDCVRLDTFTTLPDEMPPHSFLLVVLR